MNITILGTGYVGLVTGSCLASTGNNVTCLDVDLERVESITNGDIPFYEPELSELVLKSVNNGNLKFTTSYSKACENNIFFLCVGTPQDDQGDADLTFLNSALKSLLENISKDSFIFTKSTVPVGTNSYIQEYFNQDLSSLYKVYVASNPEFLREGSAVKDFMRPDRIIIGTDNPEVMSIATNLYKPFNRVSNKMIFMNLESAELTKYASNAFLATKISYMNEIANYAEKIGANIHDVRIGMGADPRIGKAFLYSGIGYGGSCFPKDVNALINAQEKSGLKSQILLKTREINEKQAEVFFNKINDSLGDLSNKSFLFWGASFKPNTDDIRESTSINLIKMLARSCKSIYLYDPIALENAKKELSMQKNIFFVNNKNSSVKDCHALIIGTEWKEFWSPDFKTLECLKDSYIFDGRNILDKEEVENFNLNYVGVGS